MAPSRMLDCYDEPLPPSVICIDHQFFRSVFRSSLDVIYCKRCPTLNAKHLRVECPLAILLIATILVGKVMIGNMLISL